MKSGSGSICIEVAILHEYVPTVAHSVDRLRVSAGIREM